ncbi:MAG: carboxylate--amine ligase [Thaumarchaeota archaeon]|jgi:uncharacterized protein|nr:carboxylate--amine ligase [Nitrososphaerota archaeon]|tara:strand:- start:7066 stop:7776 length:711 start_codon:yes stop_codon:yes gene_type:complete
MSSDIDIKEIIPINVENGILINGFPSTGLTSAVATESLINTTEFELGGIIDSDRFPPISIVKNGLPNYPTRIFVNNELKVAVFSSYLTLDVSLHKTAAKLMLNWAKEKKCSTIISSITVKGGINEEVVAVASTGTARGKLVKAGITVIENATIPGISGVLLNEGMLNGQDVIVLLISSDKDIPDFTATSNLCNVLTKLVPGVSCNLTKLEKESKIIEQQIQQATDNTKELGDNIYR